ncbi:MAG TPA: hypothetical protein VIH75_25640 [Candidatus Sulfotelmatobacter sp.]
MFSNDFRIARVQRTLRWFEQDIPLLNLRVKELSKERQESARRFAAAVIDQTRAELERLLQEQSDDSRDSSATSREPAD